MNAGFIQDPAKTHVNLIAMNNQETPRTNAQYKEYSRRDNGVQCVEIDFARQLERELIFANEKLSRLSRIIDIAESINNGKTEQEVAASATFNEAMAMTNTEFVEKELKRAKLLAKVLYLALANDGIRSNNSLTHAARNSALRMFREEME
jgi:hypothetical protein